MFGMLISMIQFFIIIVVFVVVVQRIKNVGNRSRNNRRSTGNTYGNMGYGPGNTPQNIQSKGYGNAAGNMMGTMPGNIRGKGSSPGNASPKKGGRAGLPETDGNKTAGSSTTEYLERKAMEDQREHVREKMEELHRVNAKYGNIPIARRHILGDPVPSGMEIVRCQYCGAENEVKTGSRERLGCYFCRTEL